MSNKCLWLHVYQTHVSYGADAREARDHADKAVAAAPKSFWDRFR